MRPSGLGVGQRATLELPAGSMYHSRCGPTASTFSQVLAGLLPFAFPFSNTAPPPQYTVVSYRRLNLWLRHGLEAAAMLPALQVRWPGCAFY